MADNELPDNGRDDRRAGSVTSADPIGGSSQATPVATDRDDSAAVATASKGAGVKRPGDRVFEILSTVSAALILSLIHI